MEFDRFCIVSSPISSFSHRFFPQKEPFFPVACLINRNTPKSSSFLGFRTPERCQSKITCFHFLSKQCRFRNRSEGDSPNFRKKPSSHRPFLWLCNHQWFMTLGRPPLPCQAARTAWNRSPI
jgi:hypothetical protein